MHRKALVVGIDEYGSPNINLNCCCNDAEAVKDLLANNGNGDPNFEVSVKNNIMTKGELKTAIKNCFSGDSDVALFYYSGHGFINEIGGHLVTPDYETGDEGVPLYEILHIVNKSKCKEKIVILDCCYSGDMGSLGLGEQNITNISEGVTILTASRKNETSVEIGNHGLFTSILIQALDGGAADILGRITPGGVYAYIDKALGEWGQRPVFKTNVTRFTSIRDVVPQVEIEKIRKICEYFPTADAAFKLDPSYEDTNMEEVEHKVVEPHAEEENVKKFKILQALEGIGLVVPNGEEHMYYAAMNSKSCSLTPIGQQYWRLVKEGKI